MNAGPLVAVFLVGVFVGVLGMLGYVAREIRELRRLQESAMEHNREAIATAQQAQTVLKEWV